MEKEYILSISYSWGASEPDIPFSSFGDAYEEAQGLAADEARICSRENDCEIGLRFLPDGIVLRYDDGSTCTYSIKEAAS